MLIIAEKPKMGLTIAQALGIKKKNDGFIELKNGDTVTWSIGHILELCPPQTYCNLGPDEKFYWKEEILPIMPKEFKYDLKTETKKQFKIIKDLIKQNKVICNAGDPDREGQLLIDEILEYLNVKGKEIKRVMLPDLTEARIQKAFQNIEDNNLPKFRGLSNAAKTRSYLDWLYGMNLTMGFTISSNRAGNSGVRSYGRVQTPTLALVVQRDLEIKNFKSTTHYKPILTAIHEKGKLILKWNGKNAQDKYLSGFNNANLLTDKKIAQMLCNDMQDQKGVIVSVEEKKNKKEAPLPYALSDVQKKAAKYNFGADKTLSIMQSLYEKGYTSYPRTDCNYLPENEHPNAKEILDCISRYFPEFNGYDVTKKHKAFNDKKLSAHNAIMPLENNKGISELTDDELKLYKMICESFFRLFMPEKVIKSITVKAQINGEEWYAQASDVIVKGWDINAEENEDIENEGKIPAGIKEKDTIKTENVTLQEAETTPPPYFTEGSLIDAMKNIHLHVDKSIDKKIIERLKNTKGLGTEATRANIISTLKKRNYLTIKGKNIVSTDIGQAFIKKVPADLKDPILTAMWEDGLAKVENNELQAEQVLKKCYSELPKLVKTAINAY